MCLGDKSFFDRSCIFTVRWDRYESPHHVSINLSKEITN